MTTVSPPLFSPPDYSTMVHFLPFQCKIWSAIASLGSWVAPTARQFFDEVHVAP